MSNMDCGVYRIRNIVNGNCYIGQSMHLAQRRHNHYHFLKKGTSPSFILQNAWNKYGEENFVFEILFFCDISTLAYYEQCCIDKMNSKYNLKKTGSYRGGVLSDETKRKIVRGCRIAYVKKFKSLYPKEYNEFLEETRDFDLLYGECLNHGIEKDDLRIPATFFITKKEIKVIKSINKFAIKRVLWILLCLAKYLKVLEKRDTYFVDRKMSYIFGLAKIRAPRETMLDDLEELGLISIKDVIEVNFVDNAGDPFIVLNTLKNVLEFLPNYCIDCGIEIEKYHKNNRQKRCKNCAEIEKRERNRRRSYGITDRHSILAFSMLKKENT